MVPLSHSLFSDGYGRWTFVHHLGMVGANELAFEMTACGAVDNVTIDLSVSVNRIAFPGEVFIFGMDMK